MPEYACKTSECGQTFATKMMIHPVTELSLTCPFCGKTNKYSKAEEIGRKTRW